MSDSVISLELMFNKLLHIFNYIPDFELLGKYSSCILSKLAFLVSIWT